ncbi:UTP--glucose-1-phosphate uridylyltransferase [Candidatus Poribacteria bacterium]|nr:UTP--glucose-1-phosphate uridylyltransferase [Candidatus Poribacteria bacterium]
MQSEFERKVERVRSYLNSASRTCLPDNPEIPSTYLDLRTTWPKELKQRGIELLQRNKVAALMAAGGMSTRMGGAGLRGNIPIGPVTRRSIFQLQGEKVAAIKKRFSPRMKWLIMTSPPVHDETVRSIQRDNSYGISNNDILFVETESLPVLDDEGKPIQLDNGAYLESPTGHGSLLKTVRNSDLLPRLKAEGIEYLFYFQYPNVLERVCDPFMLGYHDLNGFEFTAKGILDYKPDEKMGRIALVGGKLWAVEHHLMQKGESNFWRQKYPANTGSMLFSLSFLERCSKDCSLPWHKISHRLPGSRGSYFLKPEQSIFDLLPYAKTSGLVIVSREDEYAPVKQMSGNDSLEAAKSALVNLYRRWLDQAGAIPEHENCQVEISPLYALDAFEVQEKIHRGFRYNDGLVLRW